MAGIKTQFPSGRQSSLTAFGGQAPRQNAGKSFEHFKKYPQKDGLVLGYTGTKLKSEEMFDRQFSDRTSLRLTDNVVRLLGLNSGRHAQRRKQSKWAPTP